MTLYFLLAEISTILSRHLVKVTSSQETLHVGAKFLPDTRIIGFMQKLIIHLLFQSIITYIFMKFNRLLKINSFDKMDFHINQLSSTEYACYFASLT